MVHMITCYPLPWNGHKQQLTTDQSSQEGGESKRLIKPEVLGKYFDIWQYRLYESVLQRQSELKTSG